MELNPTVLAKQQHARWRATHVPRDDGRCAACGRVSPCIFAEAAAGRRGGNVL